MSEVMFLAITFVWYDGCHHCVCYVGLFVRGGTYSSVHSVPTDFGNRSLLYFLVDIRPCDCHWVSSRGLSTTSQLNRAYVSRFPEYIDLFPATIHWCPICGCRHLCASRRRTNTHSDRVVFICPSQGEVWRPTSLRNRSGPWRRRSDSSTKSLLGEGRLVVLLGCLLFSDECDLLGIVFHLEQTTYEKH